MSRKGRSKAPRVRKAVRFLSWYRLAPIFALLVFGFTSLFYTFAPAPLVSPLFPLRDADGVRVASGRFDVDPYLLGAMDGALSTWGRPDGSASSGVVGVSPSVSEWLSGRGIDLSDREGLEAECAYLSELLSESGGDEVRALASFAVGSKGAISPSRSRELTAHDPAVQAFVVRVLGARERYRALYGELLAP